MAPPCSPKSPANQLISGTLPAARTHFALGAARGLHARLLPGLARPDLDAPLGGGIGLTGFSAVDASQNAGAGFVSAGLRGTFHVVWVGAFSFTHFIGGAGAQPLADRDSAGVFGDASVLGKSRSFLKKRTKKLLPLEVCVAATHASTFKSFRFFFSKKKSFPTHTPAQTHPADRANSPAGTPPMPRTAPAAPAGAPPPSDGPAPHAADPPPAPRSRSPPHPAAASRAGNSHPPRNTARPHTPDIHAIFVSHRKSAAPDFTSTHNEIPIWAKCEYIARGRPFGSITSCSGAQPDAGTAAPLPAARRS